MDTFQRALDETSGGAITAQKERERQQRQQRQQQRQQQTQQPGGVQVQAQPSSTPLERSLAPVLKAEKSDLMFWMMVLQVLLLVGIWRNTKTEG